MPAFKQRLFNERTAMQAPINFADLEPRGILAQTSGGWYVLLQPAAHVRKQARALNQTRLGDHSMLTLKFYRTRSGADSASP